MSPVILLNLSYDGTEYYGWQRQPQLPSVQGVLEQALSQVYQQDVRCHGAGRTDAHAHALRYSAHFVDNRGNIPLEKIPVALNRNLPPDVRVLSAFLRPPDFHTRFSAIAREYIYHIIPGNNPSPFWRNYAYSYPYTIDLEKIREILPVFKGEHDFSDFCYGYGDEEKNTIRKIYYFRAYQQGSHLIFTIKANGFLQGMIRSLVSVTLNFQRGDRVTREQIMHALQRKSSVPGKYKIPVPAHGLFFKRAYY